MVAEAGLTSGGAEEDREALLAAARNLAAPPERLARFAEIPLDKELAEALIANIATPLPVLVAIAAQMPYAVVGRLLEKRKLAARAPEIAEAIRTNPHLEAEERRGLLVLCQEAASQKEGHKKSLLQMIRELTVSQKIALAKKGNKEARVILIKDPNEVVALEVVASPRITDVEIVAIAKMPDVSEKVLRYIGNHKQYRADKEIVWSLLNNPKTPPGVSLNLGIVTLTDRELEHLAKNRNIPGVVSRAAKQVTERRKMAAQEKKSGH